MTDLEKAYMKYAEKLQVAILYFVWSSEFYDLDEDIKRCIKKLEEALPKP